MEYTDHLCDALVKASLTHLETLESCAVLFNPTAYRVEKISRPVAAEVIGMGVSPLQFLGGGSERFLTRLLLDSGPGRCFDVRAWVDRIERWSEPGGAVHLPPPVLFSWGGFRFRGILEEVHQEWVRFARDGTPLRAWLDIVLRK
jgi:hypothetical protein